MKRHTTISIRLTAMERGSIERYIQEHGFASISELMRAVIGLLITGNLGGKAKAEPEETPSDEVRQMFAEYSNSYRQPDGTPPVRPNRRRLIK